LTTLPKPSRPNKKAGTGSPMPSSSAGTGQPRQDFSEREMQQLAASIQARGLKQPLTVRWDASADRYRVIDGGRRLKAAEQLGLEELPCWIQHVAGKEVLIDQVVHNWQRVDLKPLETAKALARLREEFSMSQQDLAHETGKPKGEISKLLAMHDDVIDEVKTMAASDVASRLTKRHLYNLSKLKPDDQRELAGRIQAENLTAVDTERFVAERVGRKQPKGRAANVGLRQWRFKTDAAELVITFHKSRFTAADIRAVLRSAQDGFTAKGS
jgi:ParB family chromosome partitioning protein